MVIAAESWGLGRGNSKEKNHHEQKKEGLAKRQKQEMETRGPKEQS